MSPFYRMAIAIYDFALQENDKFCVEIALNKFSAHFNS